MLCRRGRRIYEAGREVLALAGKQPADIDLMELYSCFPLAVRAQLQELGLPAKQSLTSAMTFGGGPLNQPWIAVGVLVFAVFAEGGSLLGCIREINKVRGERSLWRWFRESRQSELIVIFGEDLAALLGLAAALAAVLITIVTGDPFWDALGSCIIGTLLIVVAFLIGAEVKDLLVGQGVEEREREAMHSFLEEQQEIVQAFNIVTLQMGPDVMVAVKAQLVATDE